jgi:hypothetical protein
VEGETLKKRPTRKEVFDFLAVQTGIAAAELELRQEEVLDPTAGMMLAEKCVMGLGGAGRIVCTRTLDFTLGDLVDQIAGKE